MILLCLLPAVGLLAILWWQLGLPTPKCALHEWTGIPCATCGTTRAIGALVSGDYRTALLWNPLAIFGMLAAAVIWVYSAIVCVARWPRFRPQLSRGTSRVLRFGIVTVIVLNWIYLLCTLP